MKLFEFFDKMQLFNTLIKQEKTGTPDEFARRIEISRTTLYEVIDELRSRGVEISYSRRKRSFHYNNPVSLEIRFIISGLEEMNDTELRRVSGGTSIVRSVYFNSKPLLSGMNTVTELGSGVKY